MYLKDFVIVAFADVTFLSYKGKSSYNKLLVEKPNNIYMYEERTFDYFKIHVMFKTALVKH